MAKSPLISSSLERACWTAETRASAGSMLSLPATRCSCTHSNRNEQVSEAVL